MMSLGDLRQSESPGGHAPSGYFDSIPDEIIEKVLIYLLPQDLVSSLCLNTRFHYIIRNSTMVQYSFALQTFGLVDGDKTRSMDDKLGELRKREEGWRTVDTLRRVSLPGYQNLSRIYGVSNGIIFGDVCESASDDRDRGSEALKLLNLLAYIPAGSSSREDFCRDISIPGAGQIIDVYLAVNEHDLMTVISSQAIEDKWTGDIIIHLRQHSTGLSHPLAVIPEIHTEVFLTDEYWDSIFVKAEVVGSCMVIVLSVSRKDVILLIDWWKGEIIKREEFPIKTIGALAFLSHDMLFLSNKCTKLFEIIKLPDHTEQSKIEERTVKRIAYLHLPEQMIDDFDERVSCRSAPNPFGAQHPTKLAPSSHPPFSADPELAIIVVHPENNVMLIVHRNALIATLNAHVTKYPVPVEEGVHLPWADWTVGPDGGIVRWIRGEWGFNSTSFGQRLVGIQARQYLSIKDFNPYAVERARASLAMADNMPVPQFSIDTKLRTEGESRIESTFHRASQQEDVLWLSDCTYMHVIESWASPSGKTEDHGELPYVETITELEDDRYQDVVMDGEKLICVQKWDSRIKCLDVYSM